MAVLNDHAVIISGGQVNGATFSTESVTCFNLNDNSFIELADMNRARFWHSSITAGKKVYVFGGLISADDSMEVLDTGVKNSAWHLFKSPNFGRRA